MSSVQHKLNIYPKNDCIETPVEFFKELDNIFHFDFDPCPINPQFDGLKVEWGLMNYINPPFSNIKGFIQKAIEEKKKGKSSVFLITARTNTKYWFELVFPHAKKIVFLKKGLKFAGYNTVFPIPLCVVHFEGEKEEEELSFSEKKKEQLRKYYSVENYGMFSDNLADLF